MFIKTIMALFSLITIISYAYAADIVLDTAKDISTDTSNFNGVLSGTDNNVQKSLETIDDVCLANTGDTGTGNYTFKGIVKVGDNTMTNPTIIFDGQTDNPAIYYDNVLDMVVINGDVMIGTP